MDLGLIVKSPSISPKEICLRADFLGRAVLMVRDTAVISGTLAGSESAYTSSLRNAKTNDLDKSILPEIIDHLSRDHAYMFKRTWFGKHVLCRKDRYDMNLIITPIKFKSLNRLLWAYAEGNISLTGVFRIGSDKTIRLTTPDEKEK